MTITNDAVYDLSALTKDIDANFLESGGVDSARAALAAGNLPLLENADTLRIAIIPKQYPQKQRDQRRGCFLI
ncbi:MAG TPA: hypothetical protein VFC35_02750 [Gemmatimonadaceae bacterium]|nr:hypothetical protein [Gemmatimonadaceae bacterium]